MILLRKCLWWMAFHALLGAAYALLYTFLGTFWHPSVFHLVLFFALQSLVLLFWRSHSARFSALVWGAWLFRTLSSLAFLILMFWMGIQQPLAFVLHFAVLYLLYLFFELFFSLRTFTLHDHEKPSRM